MTTEKKKLQLEAVRNFWKALEDLRCAGIKQEYLKDEKEEKITLIDQETGEQVGDFVSTELLTDVTGQIFDEYYVSYEYFGDLVKSK